MEGDDKIGFDTDLEDDETGKDTCLLYCLVKESIIF